MMASDEPILVLGIGNLLWADEGFGVRAVQALHNRWTFPRRVTLLDGGTQGFNLLSFVRAAQRMIVFDAIDYGLPPGTLKVLSDQQVPGFAGSRKLSLHQTGFQEVLAVAELTGSLPAELVLIGVQPECLDDFGGNLRTVVRAQLEPAVEIALTYLRSWNCAPALRDKDLDAAELLLSASLDMPADEAGRDPIMAESGHLGRRLPLEPP